MAARYVKVVLVLIAAFLALFYAFQNIVNLEQAYGAVAYVASNAEHEAYPASFGPSITAPALIWLALGTIILFELTAGTLCARGAWDLWRNRQAPAAQFNAAKTFAILGCGMGLVVWAGLFSVIGGAYFQMWQTQVGQSSLEGAFQLVGINAFTLLFVNMPDEDPSPA